MGKRPVPVCYLLHLCSQYLLLNLSNQNVEYIFPETTFIGQMRSNIPVVFLHRGDHFESLIVPQEARTNLASLISTEITIRQGDRGAELLRLQNSESIGPPIHCSTQNDDLVITLNFLLVQPSTVQGPPGK